MARAKTIRIPSFRQVFALLGFVLVVRVMVGVLLNYVDYFPPNFESEFLRGRERYFAGGYHWAFYAHIISGPLSLILGTILISEKFRMKYRIWHRYLGRIAVPCILFVVVPSGLWMAQYVDTGQSAVVGFTMLSLVTGFFAAMGWKAAAGRRFPEHRRWMWRCYLTLCSAVVLRLFAGTIVAIGLDAIWIPQVTAWASWLVPLIVFEVLERVPRNWEAALFAKQRLSDLTSRQMTQSNSAGTTGNEGNEERRSVSEVADGVISRGGNQGR